MLSDSLKTGYPLDTPVKALGIWLAMISGSDLYAERTPAEVDEKIFLLRPYVFACFRYDMTYAEWHHRRLPLCKTGCTDHPAISSYTAQYNRFGHSHLRAPPHFVLGAYLCYMRLLERQPGRIGIKATSSTSFLDEAGTGLFSVNQLMPSVYHDPEWQRNTVCQDPHTSPGLPPLTFHGRLQGFWRARLLFFDFDAYRQMLAGNMPAVYTGTFATHAVEVELRETVIQVREEDVGGTGSLMNAGFADEETEEEQERIRKGYGHKVLTGDELKKPDPAGYTKEILLSGGVSLSDRSKQLTLGPQQLGLVSRPWPCALLGWAGADLNRKVCAYRLSCSLRCDADSCRLLILSGSGSGGDTFTPGGTSSGDGATRTRPRSSSDTRARWGWCAQATCTTRPTFPGRWPSRLVQPSSTLGQTAPHRALGQTARTHSTTTSQKAPCLAARGRAARARALTTRWRGANDVSPRTGCLQPSGRSRSRPRAARAVAVVHGRGGMGVTAAAGETAKAEAGVTANGPGPAAEASSASEGSMCSHVV